MQPHPVSLYTHTTKLITVFREQKPIAGAVDTKMALRYSYVSQNVADVPQAFNH